LLEHPARAKYDLSSMKGLFFGGAPASPELVRRISEQSNFVAGNNWGMTETSGLFLSLIGDDYTARPASCGAPLPVGDVRIMALDGAEEVAPGYPGELWVRGPQVVRGYWNDPEADAVAFVDGWLRTGDVARLDGDGFVYIVDRAKDMIIRAGENIHCIEVEAVLEQHPAVVEAAMVGRPHRLLGEEPVAFVVMKPDAAASELELRQFVAQRLATFKAPVKVYFSTEPLPRSGTGKLQKTELRRALVEEPA
jgi:long-chain acyl-CoA synthetase